MSKKRRFTIWRESTILNLKPLSFGHTWVQLLIQYILAYEILSKFFSQVMLQTSDIKSWPPLSVYKLRTSHDLCFYSPLALILPYYDFHSWPAKASTYIGFHKFCKFSHSVVNHYSPMCIFVQNFAKIGQCAVELSPKARCYIRCPPPWIWQESCAVAKMTARCALYK